MKRKRILGLWLILLMLIMTACGSNKDIVQGTVQQPESAVKASESEAQESEPEGQEQTQKIEDNFRRIS